jgi:hypothetical protein
MHNYCASAKGYATSAKTAIVNRLFSGKFHV